MRQNGNINLTNERNRHLKSRKIKIFPYKMSVFGMIYFPLFIDFRWYDSTLTSQFFISPISFGFACINESGSKNNFLVSYRFQNFCSFSLIFCKLKTIEYVLIELEIPVRLSVALSLKNVESIPFLTCRYIKDKQLKGVDPTTHVVYKPWIFF